MPSVGTTNREMVPKAATVSLPKEKPMLPTMPANQTARSRMVATIPPVIGATRVLKSRPIVTATTPSATRNAIASKGWGGR